MKHSNLVKSVGLLITLFVMFSAAFFNPDWPTTGVCVGCSINQRLTYSFFHASIIHAAINTWCFLSILFLYKIRMWQMFMAYLIAAAAPGFTLMSTPTVGMSAVCFALLGMIAFQTKRRLYYNGCMALYIVIGFIFPYVNGWLHLYSYVAGLSVGFLNMPIPCNRK